MGKKTELEFWDDYWRNGKHTCRINYRFSFERCLANELKRQLRGCSGSVLEIGCAPGRWLSFLSRELGFHPSGIEYSAVGIGVTKKNLKSCGVECSRLYIGDFLDIEPDYKYDVVVSLGFIEHFDNPDDIIARHLCWLKDDGILVLGVPNFRGINYLLQKAMNIEILDAHNLRIMRKSYFTSIARRFCLNPISIKYIGSFEPSLPIEKPVRLDFPRLAAKIVIGIGRLLRKIRLFDRINAWYFSSYILAIFQKPGN